MTKINFTKYIGDISDIQQTPRSISPIKKAIKSYIKPYTHVFKLEREENIYAKKMREALEEYSK